jgi:hypothetical protein
LIGPGGYALALVYCFSISSLLPTQHLDLGPRELGPYPGRASVGYTNRLSADTPRLTGPPVPVNVSPVTKATPTAPACAAPGPGQGPHSPRAAGWQTQTPPEPLTAAGHGRSKNLRGRRGDGSDEHTAGPELRCYFKSRPRLRRARRRHPEK